MITEEGQSENHNFILGAATLGIFSFRETNDDNEENT